MEAKHSLYSKTKEDLVLGAILLDNALLDEVVDILQPEYFYDPTNAKLYKTFLQIYSQNRIIEPKNVALILNNPELEVYCTAIAKFWLECVFITKIIEEAKIIVDLYKRRRLFETTQHIQTTATDFSISADDGISKIEESLFSITSKHADKKLEKIDTLTTLSLELINKYKTENRNDLIDTSFQNLNKILYGFGEGELIILGARPSMGKTALAISMGLGIAKQGKSVAIFSLEMQNQTLMTRIMSAEARVPAWKLRTGKVSDTELERLTDAHKEFQKLDLFFNDKSAITASFLRSQLRKQAKKKKCDLVIIDYLQLMRDNVGENSFSKNDSLGKITAELKSIAKDFKIPILVLSQLSRSVESRENKRPQLQDLRDSGSIEQDADVVLMLYRDEYYQKKEIPAKEDVEAYNQWIASGKAEKYEKIEHQAELIVAKNRQGESGTALLFFDKEYFCFRDLN